MKHKALMWSFSLVAITFVLVRDACAYIDPGTGSYIFQILIASVLGGLFALKIFWKNIKAALTRKSSTGEGQEDDKQQQ
ncbi:MAG TPA: hypothetical protein VM223_04825 [Planctomycetota bacterium]|nr:hypothetical protein [Planctomycetota bacterium]